MKPIRVFIGYDPKEAEAFNVLQHSIHIRASKPISIVPIMLTQIKKFFQREMNPLQSTEFSFSRFLTPYLSNYKGWSIFMDCDMIVLDDIVKLYNLKDDKYAFMCVKHEHNPSEESKFLGAVQTKYQKKNWSSVILFNNKKCKALTPEYVNTASGLELHQFKWLNDDNLIGEIPKKWNHLVGYDKPNSKVSLVHYTSGGPYFNEYKGCEYEKEWLEEKDKLLYVAQREYSKENPSERFLKLKKLYQQMHIEGDKNFGLAPEKTFSGQSLPAQANKIKNLCDTFQAKSIFDYGCGKGQQYKPMEIKDNNGNILFNSILEYWGVSEIKLYDPNHKPFIELPTTKSDGVICTDVLEHIPEEDISWVIEELFKYANKFVFANIACFPAKKHLPNGENAHCTIREPQWWKDRIDLISIKYPEIKCRFFLSYINNGQMEEIKLSNL